MMEKSGRIVAEATEPVIDLRLPPAVQRATLLYQWFRTTPVVDSGKIIVCR